MDMYIYIDMKLVHVFLTVFVDLSSIILWSFSMFVTRNQMALHWITEIFTCLWSSHIMDMISLHVFRCNGVYSVCIYLHHIIIFPTFPSNKPLVGFNFQPFWKRLVNLDHSPNRDQNNKSFNPPPRTTRDFWVFFSIFKGWTTHDLEPCHVWYQNLSARAASGSYQQCMTLAGKAAVLGKHRLCLHRLERPSHVFFGDKRRDVCVRVFVLWCKSKI